jgi:hypothetical protein
VLTATADKIATNPAQNITEENIFLYYSANSGLLIVDVPPFILFGSVFEFNPGVVICLYFGNGK